jgi:predicted ArsR family transcriptional regulator
MSRSALHSTQKGQAQSLKAFNAGEEVSKFFMWELEQMGLLEEELVQVGRGRPQKFLTVSEKGQALLNKAKNWF